VYLLLHSVVSYEERTGTLSSLIAIHLKWTDELLAAIFPSGISDGVSISKSSIWNPYFQIYNTVTEDTVLKLAEDSREHVLFAPNGTIMYTNVGLAVTKCDGDVFFYPMDQQKCNVTFFSVEPLRNVEIQPFFVEYSGMDPTLALLENEVWEASNVQSEIGIMLYNYSSITLSFTLSRQPLYLAMNFVIPLAYICLLNLFVFLLPESSGERISYAVTMLLALILYLNMIADRLPNTVPISLLNIMIVIQLNSSCFVVLMTILTLWMYNKQENNQPISRLWRMLARVTNPKCSRKTKLQKINPRIKKGAEVREIDGKRMKDYKMQEFNKEKPVTWSDVMCATNRLLFVITFTILCVQAIVFLFSMIRLLL
jgi:hypothetical protein